MRFEFGAPDGCRRLPFMDLSRVEPDDLASIGRSCLIVGAILTAINQGDRLVRGEIDGAMAWKIGLTFLVPFVVATISGAAVIRSRDDSNGS